MYLSLVHCWGILITRLKQLTEVQKREAHLRIIMPFMLLLKIISVKGFGAEMQAFPIQNMMERGFRICFKDKDNCLLARSYKTMRSIHA